MQNPLKSSVWECNPEYIRGMAVTASINLCVDYRTITLYTQFCALNNVQYATFNNPDEYTSLHASK